MVPEVTGPGALGPGTVVPEVVAPVVVVPEVVPGVVIPWSERPSSVEGLVGHVVPCTVPLAVPSTGSMT